MLRTDLLDLLHTKQMWAFVGAGASMDAGLPSWAGLLRKAADRLGVSDTLSDPGPLGDAFKAETYARVFGELQRIVGREALVGVVREELSGREPGEVLKALADLPFAGYVTTNYDGLLIEALRHAGRHPAPWTVVGNTTREARKVTGGAEHVVWHVHGALDLPEERSRLLLTQGDYEDVYDTGMLQTLQGLIEQRRVVFVGFGFMDRDVRWLLQAVERRTVPEHPVFAFLDDKTATPEDRERLLLDQNVSVIPYRVLDDGSHRRLTELLRVYASMTLSRSLELARGRRERPGFDPATTGLLLYNELVLKDGTRLGGEALTVLVRTRVLALLAEAEMTQDAIKNDMLASIGQVGDGRPERSVRQAVKAALVELEHDGLVEPVGDVYRLTDAGEAAVGSQAGRARVMDEQFHESLRMRAIELTADDERAGAVADAAHAFITDSLATRALGLALAVDRWDIGHQRYHMASLLQTLPKYAESLEDEGEVIALADLIRGLVESPTEAEETYIGVVIQARFAGHLMGYDAEVLAARTDDVQRTAFVVDSNTLIPFLSVGSGEHEAARLLVDQLAVLGSAAVTTAALSGEVARHANWALGQVDPSGAPTERTLMAGIGATGERGNQFLQGFLAERSAGRVRDLPNYLRSVCGIPMMGRRVTASEVTTVLGERGVRALDFADEIDGVEGAIKEMDKMEGRIAAERIGADTYTGYRQTSTEARVAWLVQGLREGTVPIEGCDVDNAFFVSPSRAVDRAVSGSGRPITMHPEALRQWVTTLVPRPESEMRAFAGCLRHELSERGLSVVNRDQLRTAFGPTIQASKESRAQVLAAYRDLSSRKYATNPADAFNNLDPVYQPTAALAAATQAALESKAEADRQRERADNVAKTEKMNAKELLHFERLKSEKERRKKKHKNKN